MNVSCFCFFLKQPPIQRQKQGAPYDTPLNSFFRSISYCLSKRVQI